MILKDEVCWFKSLRESAGAQAEDARNLSQDLGDHWEVSDYAKKAADRLDDVYAGIDNLIVGASDED